MVTRFQKHCSDESLIAHLDGELPFYRRSGVQKHLENCWQCRARLDEIDQQALAMTRAMAADVFPGPERIAHAREVFLARADAIADEMLNRPRAARFLSPARLAWAAACIALMAAYPAWRLLRPADAPTMAEAIAQVQAAETSASSVPVHQKFRVLVRQLEPTAESREHRLELWSDAPGGRFTERLSAADGTVKFAAWQPERGRQYVLDGPQRTTVVRLTRDQATEQWSALQHEGLTLEQFEVALLAWLRNRPWQPVSLSADIARLVSSDGVSLEVERSQTRTMRLRARQHTGQQTIEFSMEVDPATYKPQLQFIRYESRGRVLEVLLYSEPVSQAMPASFEPPSELAPRPLHVPPEPAVTAVPAPVAPDPTLVEAQVFYALHRVHACLGEPVEIVRAADGALSVRATLVDSTRTEQVRTALSGLPVALDLRSSLDEFQKLGSLRQHEPATALTSPARRTPPDIVLRSFAGNIPDAEQFLDRLSSAGEDLMKEAQALRDLALRFPSPKPDEPKRLIHEMTRDHVDSLRVKARSIRTLLVRLSVEQKPAPSGRVVSGPVELFELARQVSAGIDAFCTRDGDVAGVATALDGLEAGLPSSGGFPQ